MANIERKVERIIQRLEMLEYRMKLIEESLTPCPHYQMCVAGYANGSVSGRITAGKKARGRVAE